MKAIYPTNGDTNRRLVVRAGSYYPQRCGSDKGTKTFDPWFDAGPAIEGRKVALAWLNPVILGAKS